MPLSLDCVKAYCTVGEISDALHDVFGTYEDVLPDLGKMAALAI